jgi:hypothetical protein
MTIQQRRFVSTTLQTPQLVQGPKVASISQQNWTPIYTLVVPALVAGECLILHGEFEVTTNYLASSGVNPMIVSRIQVGGTPLVDIDEPNGTNVTPAQHHWVEKRDGSFQAQVNMTNVQIELLAFSARDLLTPGDVALVINTGSGQLEAIIV